MCHDRESTAVTMRGGCGKPRNGRNGMEFSLTEEQTAIRDMARNFADEKIAPHALEWDGKGHFPEDVVRSVGELGMAGICVREDVGGAGLTRFDAALIFEALAYGCPSISSFISIHNMVAWMIDTFGSEEQRQAWLPVMCRMGKIASYCLTEPGSGSDAAALKTRAARDGNQWSLNGAKSFISGGGVSDLYLVMARTGRDGPHGVSAVLVENGTPGLSFGANERKMGWRAQPTSVVQFDDCRVPADRLIGEEGKGFRYILSGMNAERILIAAECIGDAKWFIDKATTYAKERVVFGRPIGQNQGVQFPIAKAYAQMRAAELMVHRAAALFEAGRDCGAEANMAKMLAADASWAAAEACVQTHGGFGFAEEYDVERKFRETRLYQVAPISTNLVLSYVAEHVLGMPRSY
jgi:alkylation response protein AidB-like acyl-CoA dehydrogenase